VSVSRIPVLGYVALKYVTVDPMRTCSDLFHRWWFTNAKARFKISVLVSVLTNDF